MEQNTHFIGRAIIDESLNILTADTKLSKYLGNNAMYTLARSIHPNDINRLEDGLKVVSIEQSTIISLRMVDDNGRYQWVIMLLVDIPKNRNHDRQIRIELHDIAEVKSLHIAEDENYMQYFSLMEHLMFSYDIYTDKLKIFMMGNQQQVNFYNGTLTDWEKTMITNGNIDEIYKNVFNMLCSDFRKGTKQFEHEFKMRIFEGTKAMDWCLIKGKSIIDSSAKTHVIATMSKVNPVDNLDNSYNTTEMLDACTGILNKKAIEDYASKIIASKPIYPVTIAVLDIDDFKYINDEYGELFGDEVLNSVATIIKDAVGVTGGVGRIGDDEILIVAQRLGSNADIRSLLRTIRNNIAFMYNNEEDKPQITCSIGSATYPEDATTYEKLCEIAYKVLHLAKEKGKNRYIIYIPELHSEFINGLGKAKSAEYMFYKYRKMSIVNDIINDYKVRGKDSFEASVKKIQFAFSIDSIFVYEKTQNQDWNRFVLLGDNDSSDDNSYLDERSYIADFSEDGIEVINNINFFERRAKKTVEAFKKMGINQAIQVIVGDKNKIVSFNRNKQMSKWSRTDIMYLAILGNIFGTGFFNE